LFRRGHSLISNIGLPVNETEEPSNNAHPRQSE
jgi:hypothetical protein